MRRAVSDIRQNGPEREDEGSQELLVRFWFTEQESAGFKMFALFAVAWFALAFVLAKGFGAFENAAELTREGKLWLIVVTGVPVILAVYVILRFFWWVSAYLARVAGWAEAGKKIPAFARWFWFLVPVVGAYLYVDPLDNFGRLIAQVDLVARLEQYGIPAFNPMLVLFRLSILFFLVLLLWNYIKQGIIIAWDWLKETWGFAVSIPQGLAVTLVCFLRPNVCVEYPEHRDELPENFRGRHVLVADERGMHKCTACRACERVCPDRLILISAVRNPETKKSELTGFLLDNSRCCFCGLCEDACPTGAIKHTPEYEYSCYERNDMVLDLFAEYFERTAELRAKFGGARVS